jgi:hypothetical protein
VSLGALAADLSVSFSRRPSSCVAVTRAGSAVVVDGIEGVRDVGFEIGTVSWDCGGVGTWLSLRRALEGTGTAVSCTIGVAVDGSCTASFVGGSMAAASCLAELTEVDGSFRGMAAETCLCGAGFSIGGVD